jgi:nucleotide-binding universal stress UspA family protein
MTVVGLIRRLRDEFTAMPGLRLTERQVQRLCDVSASTSASAFRALVSVGFLRPFEESIPGLIDVHVATGASHDDLLQSAREIRADLIVLGRRHGGAACLSQLREILRDAPCHVLVVHPSGQAAVA